MFIFIALTCSNLLYQYTQQPPDLSVAVERSFFQGVAILLYWLYMEAF